MKTLKLIAILGLALPLISVTGGCDSADLDTTPLSTPAGNIAEVAASAGSFGTLLIAADAAGLVDTLTNGGPFTVFAPTDAAFNKLGSDTIDSLLDPSNVDQLRSILLYHVVPGTIVASDVLASSTLPTVQGQLLTIDAANVRVNNSNIIQTDIPASNGVIHVIDTVLIP